MNFTAQVVPLKNGGSAILRTPEKKDAAALLAYIKQAFGETEFLSRYPEEMESFSVESEERWIESQNSTPDALSLVCCVDDRIIGNCQITRLSGKKLCHRASIALAILQDYWGLGIGGAMFDAMLAAAKEWGVEIVELDYIEGNERALRLYEKKGFEIVGKRPNAYKLRDGHTYSEYFMQKRL